MNCGQGYKKAEPRQNREREGGSGEGERPGKHNKLEQEVIGRETHTQEEKRRKKNYNNNQAHTQSRVRTSLKHSQWSMWSGGVSHTPDNVSQNVFVSVCHLTGLK